MSRNEFLGEFEQIVLLTVARLEKEAYGMAIRQELEGRIGRAVAIGSVYSALDRMERKGYLRSNVGDPTPVRGGRAKRFYSLCPPAFAALRRSREVLDGLWEGLELDPRSVSSCSPASVTKVSSPSST